MTPQHFASDAMYDNAMTESEERDFAFGLGLLGGCYPLDCDLVVDAYDDLAFWLPAPNVSFKCHHVSPLGR
jgi:hypothetical protein